MADELKLDTERMRTLGQSLRDRFVAYDKSRSTVEEQWLKNVRQYVGEYDPKILQYLKPEQSRAYPRITRVKVLSIVARLHALLFPAGESNWGIESSPQPILPSDKLAELMMKWVAENPERPATQSEMDRVVKLAADDISKRMQEVINDQLADAGHASSIDYQDLVRDVIFSGALYGCGVLKGPMTIQEDGAQLVVDDNGVPQVIEQPLYRPYFEFVPIWDYYPDFSAKSFAQQDGEFQRHIYSRNGLKELASRHDYLGDQINEYLRTKPHGNYTKKSYEQALDQISDDKQQSQPGEEKKFELIEFWGCVTGHDLRAAGVEVSDSSLDKDAWACIWMIDNVIIKAAQNPYPKGVAMYHQFVFEKDEVNLTGSGLPHIMRDSQLGVSSFTRMLVDNAATVCGPSVEIDMDQLAPSAGNYTIAPFTVYKKDNASPNGTRAVQSVSFDSHMSELTGAIQLMREFADSETFVGPMTGGDFENAPSEALRTQGNMSMALASSALPFKDIVRNFDRFTKSVIHALVQWNLIYHERREELNGDLRPIPKGASSLMAKEVRAVALDRFASTLTPEDRMYINEEELLKERMQVNDLPLDRLMAAPEEIERRKAAAAEQAQQAQQQNDQMFQANLRSLQTEALKDMAQAQKNMDTGDAMAFKALLLAIKEGANIDELRRLTEQSQGQPTGEAGRQPGGARGATDVPAGSAG
jgi:hypothetical protein